MSVIVKICGITNPAEGLAAAHAGADALGFVFAEASPRHVSLRTAAEILREIPPFIVRVGVFVNAPEDLVYRAIAECGLNLLQFHGDETPEYCGQFGLMTMKAFRIRDNDSLKMLPVYETDAWLLDTYTNGVQGGSGEKFNWEIAVDAGKLGKPIFLALRFNAGQCRRRCPAGSAIWSRCLQWRRSGAR